MAGHFGGRADSGQFDRTPIHLGITHTHRNMPTPCESKPLSERIAPHHQCQPCLFGTTDIHADCPRSDSIGVMGRATGGYAWVHHTTQMQCGFAHDDIAVRGPRLFGE